MRGIKEVAPEEQQLPVETGGAESHGAPGNFAGPALAPCSRANHQPTAARPTRRTATADKHHRRWANCRPATWPRSRSSTDGPSSHRTPVKKAASSTWIRSVSRGTGVEARRRGKVRGCQPVTTHASPGGSEEPVDLKGRGDADGGAYRRAARETPRAAIPRTRRSRQRAESALPRPTRRASCARPILSQRINATAATGQPPKPVAQGCDGFISIRWLGVLRFERVWVETFTGLRVTQFARRCGPVEGGAGAGRQRHFAGPAEEPAAG